MGNFILGMLTSLILIIVLLGVVVYKYYKKNKKDIASLKAIFNNNDLDFGFKDKDFED